ncbi:SGNH hydrolase-type esterase domain-containing protein [Spinellus fusiger]|nr:SGNH hydrolase-type esterase domain-containing protein [Spinellus fusiger]KAI7867465.1 SGNH hydrolase-type esterase domain-containing protein [Spinellus fusiger]
MSSKPYTHVSSYQVLQRDANNTATVHLPGKDPIVLGVGGPYQIEDAVHVRVGDVWVMAGQSNMRGHGFLAHPFTKEPFTPASLPQVHLFGSDETWSVAKEPTHQLAVSLRRVHHTLPDPTVRDPFLNTLRGASLGVAFGNAYYDTIKVPVGLIASAHGGVTLQQWSPFLEDKEHQDTLFGAMVGRIQSAGDRIAGILWYQGESEAVVKVEPNYYSSSLSNLIKMSRSCFGLSLPFVVAQIGRWTGTSSFSSWDRIREEQASMVEYERVQVVASIDCSMDDYVHLSAKGLCQVGKRMAVGAIALVQSIPGSVSPRVHSVVCQSIDRQHSLLVSFDPPDVQWQALEQVYGFILSEGEIVRADIEGYSVRVYVTEYTMLHIQKNQVYLYYGHGENPICNMKTTLVGIDMGGVREGIYNER